jgi:hypothetical protein
MVANLLLFLLINWSGRADLNRRPPAPKAGTLTRLRYVPMLDYIRVLPIFYKLGRLAHMGKDYGGELAKNSSCPMARISFNFCRASPRWLMRFLVARSSSATMA